MLLRICTLAFALTTCLVSSVHGSKGAEESSDQSNRPRELLGQPSWFPLGEEVYHSQDRFKAERKLLAFKPQPRWFVGLVRGRGRMEEQTPPKRLDDVPVADQGASLSLSVSPAESPDHVRFSLTLKAAERTVWREVEHRWTNTLPLLFAFYADGKAVTLRLRAFDKSGGVKQSHEVAEKGRERAWSLLVDLKSLEAILESRQPRELEIVAVFSERQHEAYYEGQKLRPGSGMIESRVPRRAIVVRSNVVRLKRLAERWKTVTPSAHNGQPHRDAARRPRAPAPARPVAKGPES